MVNTKESGFLGKSIEARCYAQTTDSAVVNRFLQICPFIKRYSKEEEAVPTAEAMQAYS